MAIEVLDQGAAIGRAQLERRVLERGADRPPHEARILHHPGAHQGRHIGVEFLLGAKQLRHAGARQLVIGGEPIALEPGRPRVPERRGCRQRHEQRKIGQHARHHVDALVRVRQLDMHMHAAQHVALTDHLQVVHDGVVALGRALLHVAPGRGRMRAGGEDREPVLGRDPGQGLAQETQLLARGRHVGVRQGRDLRPATAGARRSPARRSRSWRLPGMPPAWPAPPTWCRRRPERIPPQSRTCRLRPRFSASRPASPTKRGRLREVPLQDIGGRYQRAPARSSS